MLSGRILNADATAQQCFVCAVTLLTAHFSLLLLLFAVHPSGLSSLQQVRHILTRAFSHGLRASSVHCSLFSLSFLLHLPHVCRSRVRNTTDPVRACDQCGQMMMLRQFPSGGQSEQTASAFQPALSSDFLLHCSLCFSSVLLALVLFLLSFLPWLQRLSAVQQQIRLLVQGGASHRSTVHCLPTSATITQCT